MGLSTRDHRFCSHSRSSQHFMEPEGSLPHSQELSNCPYPDPDDSTQQPPLPILALQDSSEYYPPTYVLVFLVVSLLESLFQCGLDRTR
jgi:hypothetical protein